MSLQLKMISTSHPTAPPSHLVPSPIQYPFIKITTLLNREPLITGIALPYFLHGKKRKE